MTLFSGLSVGIISASTDCKHAIALSFSQTVSTSRIIVTNATVKIYGSGKLNSRYIYIYITATIR